MSGSAAQRSANAQAQQKAAAQAKAKLEKEHEQHLLAHKEVRQRLQVLGIRSASVRTDVGCVEQRNIQLATG